MKDRLLQGVQPAGAARIPTVIGLAVFAVAGSGGGEQIIRGLYSDELNAPIGQPHFGCSADSPLRTGKQRFKILQIWLEESSLVNQASQFIRRLSFAEYLVLGERNPLQRAVGFVNYVGGGRFVSDAALLSGNRGPDVIVASDSAFAAQPLERLDDGDASRLVELLTAQPDGNPLLKFEADNAFPQPLSGPGIPGPTLLWLFKKSIQTAAVWQQQALILQAKRQNP